MTIQAETSRENPDSAGSKSPSIYRNPLDVGPQISLSTLKLASAVVGAVAVVCGIGWVIVNNLAPDRAVSVAVGGGAALGGQLLGILWLRPWKVRFLGRWPMAWMAARGVSMAGLLISVALLYSALRPDPVVFGLTTASAFFASLLAEVAAYAHDVKARTGAGTS